MKNNDANYSGYDRFYFKGGWEYSERRGRKFIVKRIVKPLNLKKGIKLLELGCGQGFHSHIFSKLGFEVIGVDSSKVAIDYAKKEFPQVTFYNLDAKDLLSELQPETFNAIYARGMSWYHYELNGVNKFGINVQENTKKMFHLLKEGGKFILHIHTDFSGTRPEPGVHNNRYSDYVNLFESLGRIVYISDTKGKILRTEEDALKSKKHIIICTQKIND